jgi:hypothetical protein
MTPYNGCGELAEFPNFGSVQLPRRVQLLGHVRYNTLKFYTYNKGSMANLSPY